MKPLKNKQMIWFSQNWQVSKSTYCKTLMRISALATPQQMRSKQSYKNLKTWYKTTNPGLLLKLTVSLKCLEDCLTTFVINLTNSNKLIKITRKTKMKTIKHYKKLLVTLAKPKKNLKKKSRKLHLLPMKSSNLEFK